jgi:hypothetical protein
LNRCISQEGPFLDQYKIIIINLKKKKKKKKKQKIIATLDKYFPCGLFEKKSSSWLGAILMGRHIPRLKEWAQAFNF